MYEAIIHYTYLDGEDPEPESAHHYRDTFKTFDEAMDYADRHIKNLEGYGLRFASLFVYSR